MDKIAREKTLRIFIWFFVVVTVFVAALGMVGMSGRDVPAVNVVSKIVSYKNIGRVEKKRIVIERDINLGGGECRLPQGMTLVFDGGILKNGTVYGSDTKISSIGAAFDRVTIKGTWNVRNISTKLFVDLGYENSLKDVFALASPKVKNTIIIEKGDYIVKALKNGDVCLPVCDNTELIINGTISLAPNDFKHYYILNVKGKNINIRGRGSIIGDRRLHTGSDGQWGMGINLKGAVNTTISGLTIKDCWGDCIYVGGMSKNVLIEKCTLDGGRRQGISITKANGVTIRNSTITNVSGTNPQYAIDVEPNRRDSVDNVKIENVTIKDCEGGFLVTCRAREKGNKTPWIGSVSITDCDVSCKKKYPVRVKRCEKIDITKCNLYAPDDMSAVSITNVGIALITNNNVSVNYGLIHNIKSELMELVGKGKNNPIDIRKTNRTIVRQNRISQL